MAKEEICFDKKGNTWTKARGEYTKIKEEEYFTPNFYEPNVLYSKKL
jgi:hypothetical protein